MSMAATYESSTSNDYKTSEFQNTKSASRYTDTGFISKSIRPTVSWYI